MSTFNLKIVTPEGFSFNDDVNSVIVRAVDGDVCILAGHSDFVSPIESGRIKIKLTNGKTLDANCEGGFISVKNGAVKILTDYIKN